MWLNNWRTLNRNRMLDLMIFLWFYIDRQQMKLLKKLLRFFKLLWIRGTLIRHGVRHLSKNICNKGSKSDASNNRPISLTSILSKLCEHILHSTILTHLAKHNVLHNLASEKRSCDTQLLLALNIFARGLEDKSQTDIIFLHFAKAFEKVSQQTT